MGNRFLSLLLCLAFGFVAGARGLPAAAAEPNEADFLEDLQHRTFLYFWETTPKENGLTPDRWPSESPCSIAAVGFALTSYAVGVERGWVDRDEAAQRTLNTLRFFDRAPQHDGAEAVSGHHGMFYHFLDMESGFRWRDCELSSIDTALLMMGVLFACEYYDQDTPTERRIRELGEELYQRVEWDWIQPRAPLVCMSWRPEQKDFGRADYRGYNEAMFLYVLAIASPTHGIDPSAWDAYTRTYHWEDYYGHAHVNFAPLFGHQYSHVWIDFRGIQDRYTRDRGIDYFENSRRATLAQREYAIANPAGWRGYGPDVWGLTACDGPGYQELEYLGKPRQFHGYSARGAAGDEVRDDGTISPTAAGGSIPFAPDETIRALRTMRERYGDLLYGEYGFLDSFNPSFEFPNAKLNHGRVHPGRGWVNQDYLGIDQGPILLMAENHRTDFVWSVMRKNPHITRGLRLAGFSGGWLNRDEDQTE